MVKIIGIVGKAGAGKDTVAKMLVQACWAEVLPYFDIRMDYLARLIKSEVYRELTKAGARMVDTRVALREALWGTQEQKESAIYVPHGRALMLATKDAHPMVSARVEPLYSSVVAPWAVYANGLATYDIYTGRQLMQTYGDYCRAAFPGYATQDIWERNEEFLLRKDDVHQQLLIVTDCRRKDEIEQLHKLGAVFIHVIDATGGNNIPGRYASHGSETGLDDLHVWNNSLPIATFYNDKRKGVSLTKLELFTELGRLHKEGFFYGAAGRR